MNFGGIIRERRERQREKEGEKEATEPSAAWPGRDRVGDEVMESYTVILRTRGCRLGKASGCSMCGYPTDGTGGVGEEEVMQQLESALDDAPEEELYLKLFTSGSLLDDWELPVEAQDAVIQRLSDDDRVTRLSVETLPRFVTEDNLERLRGNYDLEIATGLESSSEKVREVSLNKPMKTGDYEEAVRLAHDADAEVKTYLLLKPPFLPEPTALKDAVESGHYALETGTDAVSLNLCTVQSGTLVEHLWYDDGYRPPWLWTAHQALRRIKERAGDRVVISDPVAAGQARGPSNCGDCDEEAAEALREFSLTQDLSVLDEPGCSCRREWEERLNLEERLHHPAPLYDDL